MNKKVGYFILLLVFISTGYFSYRYFGSGGSVGLTSPLSTYQAPKSTNGEPASINPSEPKTEECPLNGELLPKTQKDQWEKRRPLGVMIENHKEARPQSGLSSADVVYEAVAEGGITRFLAVFYCKNASFIGPIRSARIYFVNLLREYGNNPLYAHVGGANTPGPADALGEINELGWGNYNDLNQFAVPFPYYWRDPERLPNRAVEHTVYSSTSKLWDYAAKNRKLTNVDEDNIKWNSKFTKWQFKDEATAAERGDKTKISFGFWTTNSMANDYAVVWDYDKTTNSYKRSNGGEAHLDKNTGKAIDSKNVVVVFAKESVANDGYDAGQHMLYKIIGSGEGLLFQDGKATAINWSKSDAEERMAFTDSKGKKVTFNRGQIFIEVLPLDNKVTY